MEKKRARKCSGKPPDPLQIRLGGSVCDEELSKHAEDQAVAFVALAPVTCALFLAPCLATA